MDCDRKNYKEKRLCIKNKHSVHTPSSKPVFCVLTKMKSSVNLVEGCFSIAYD